MRFNPIIPPRKYSVGNEPIEVSDVAHIELDPDEQVTFRTESGGEFDVARKSWGYYATPSVNVRLKNFGFKTALIRNELHKYHILLVETEKMEEFMKYIEVEKLQVLEWLDERSTIEK